MQSAPIPPNETKRLKALLDLAILDTGPEFLYDDVTELASQICETPICLVSLVDADRQWFKSKHGVDIVQGPRETAFCGHAILGQGLFEIEDSSKDIRFHDNPLVTGGPKVRFYAGVPLDLGDGLPVGTLCVIDDKPRRLTDKQKSALRCLANQVIAHLRLRRSNLELEKALKAKSSFLATMSHEIRTPMNGIIGITNLLIGSTRDPETREQLQIIGDCSDVLLTLLNDILDISKIESGMAAFESHPFSLRNLIRNAKEVLAPIARTKGLGLIIDMADAPDWVIGDSTRLTQILMNLLGNALKFTASGNVALSVARAPAAQGKTRLTFMVRDEGIGIAKEAQETLFRPFIQADASTTRKYGGTGLGLAIVKGLVEGMGGKLELSSEPGKGATFSVSLDYALTDPPAAVAVPPQAGGEGLIARPLTILVAEDNRVNQIVALKLLDKLGYNADLAANGLEVMQMMKTKEYDLILMDCQMPEMDGFEAMESITADYAPEKRPTVYALTAAIMADEQARCLAAGMAKVLRKPISLEALRVALLECPVRPLRA